MSNESTGSNLSPTEEITVITLAGTGILAVLSVATWHRLLAWMVDQKLLLPAAQDPLVTLPAGAGVGLDVPRLAIASAVLVFIVVFGIAALRRRGDEEAPR